jgi:hypothetical protein
MPFFNEGFGRLEYADTRNLKSKMGRNKMKAKQYIMTSLAVLMAVTAWAAEMPTEPRGGQPPKGSKPSVKNFTEQVTCQRAFEAVV